jgi:hypothetical protein
MKLRKVKLTEDNQGTFEIKEIDGKTAFLFDTPPALLFISSDGTGRTTYVFNNGEHIADLQTIQINAGVDELVNFSIGKTAASKIRD